MNILNIRLRLDLDTHGTITTVVRHIPVLNIYVGIAGKQLKHQQNTPILPYLTRNYSKYKLTGGARLNNIGLKLISSSRI